MYRHFFKRLIDVAITLPLVLLLLPVYAILTVLLFIQNNGKPFFLQERPGRHTRRFFIIKFKTMTDARDAAGQLLPDKDRVTQLGSWLRRSSLDELPQLFNVLKGDMSLVGPRPLLFRYIPLYNETQMRRHNARPGITGWAQVNGRNSIPWSQKFALDVYYVDHMSLLLDVRILWLTLLKVLRREGVNQSENRPMEPFNGHN